MPIYTGDTARSSSAMMDHPQSQHPQSQSQHHHHSRHHHYYNSPADRSVKDPDAYHHHHYIHPQDHAQRHQDPAQGQVYSNGSHHHYHGSSSSTSAYSHHGADQFLSHNPSPEHYYGRASQSQDRRFSSSELGAMASSSSHNQQSMHAADTLLMLSTAAFMDPIVAQSVRDEQGEHKEHRHEPQASHSPQPKSHSGHNHSHYGVMDQALDQRDQRPRGAAVLATHSHPRPRSPSPSARPSREHHGYSLAQAMDLDKPTSSSQAASMQSKNRHEPRLPPTLISSASMAGPHPVSINTALLPPLPQESKRSKIEEDEAEEDEEDEVMSEGVVHVNTNLAPFSPQSKSASSGFFAHHPHPTLPRLPPFPPFQPSASRQDSPRSPASKTPRGSKQPRTPKPRTPRTPKRQNDRRDVDGSYFFSPYPSCSPSSSPSSPSYLSHLQQLTHNFVSIQPHASPTNRFRRIPSAIITSAATTSTPPVSPPGSPGKDLTCLTPTSASSPTKQWSKISEPGIPMAKTPSGSRTPQRSHFKPRWHTQPYMMFLALRAMPDRTAARQELIMAAVELDKKFSAEKGLPRVFTGKTPMNSASACLTNNGDKYFIPFKPEGSRSTHFRLAYQPGNFETAVQEYNGWMEKLVQHDWPLCFGVPKEGALPIRMQAFKNQMPPAFAPEENLAGDGKDVKVELQVSLDPISDSRKRGPEPAELEHSQDPLANKKVKQDEEEQPSLSHAQPGSSPDAKVTDKMERLDIRSTENPFSSAPTAVLESSMDGASLETRRVQEYRLEDLDQGRVPGCLLDLVRVDTSTIPNSGQGLFAKVDLPASTPLGFYFGVPMTENEFDSLKDGVGAASQYSIMYRRTVLDATDENGMPYSDPNGPLYCPFHFMNEDLNGNISFVTGSVVNQVICTTNRNIQAGEELFVFYGREGDRHWIQGQDAPGSDLGDVKGPRGGSRSRAGSPTRKPVEDLGDRPRRSTVYKPARYTR